MQHKIEGYVKNLMMDSELIILEIGGGTFGETQTRVPMDIGDKLKIGQIVNITLDFED